PIEVATLAKIAGRSPFHFSRVFAQSVGITPHRYVVHLRLQRAVELARRGRFGLAEIAIRTGFADQSHLWRWVRRVHGISLTQLADTQREETNKFRRGKPKRRRTVIMGTGRTRGTGTLDTAEMGHGT